MPPITETVKVKVPKTKKNKLAVTQIVPVARKTKGARQPIGFLNTAGVGSTERAVMAPAAYSESMKSFARVQSVKNPRYGDAIRVKGQDLLTRGTFSTTGDSMLLNIMLSLVAMTGTRLQIWSQMYEKFLFRKLRFHVVPSVPTTNSGSYIVAYDRDPTDPTPPSDLGGSRALMSYENSCEFPIWVPGAITCPLIQPDEGYYTGSGTDERLFTQGQLYIWQLDAASVANLSFTVYVEYECDFFVPQLEQINGLTFGSNSGSATPSNYIAASTSAPYTLFNILPLLGQSIIGSAGTLGIGPENASALLLQAGDYYIRTALGNSAPNNYSGGGTLSNILYKLIAVNPREQQLCQQTLEHASASSTPLAGLAYLESENSSWITVPPGGAWLAAALSTGAFGSAVGNLILQGILFRARKL